VPASVLGMFPPHMEFPSIKRNGRVKTAPITGTGKGCLSRRKKRYVQGGRRKVPKTVTSLKEICKGITHERMAIKRKGKGK